MSNKRTDAHRAASNHWSNKRFKTGIEIVHNGESEESAITVQDSEDDDEIQTLSDKNPKDNKDEFQGHSKTKKSFIRLISNPSYDLHDSVKLKNQDVNNDTLSISDLIGMPDLKQTFQFNFNVDLPFFLTYIHPEAVKEKSKITFVTGSSLLSANDPDTILIKRKFNIDEIVADLPNRFASHHTKMMVNIYEDESLEFIVMTCNLTQLDFGGLTQMCWRSGRLKKNGSMNRAHLRGSRFCNDMTRYLNKYNKFAIHKLADSLIQYDFLCIDIEILPSAPGTYDMTGMSDDSEIYGYGKLHQLLKRNHILLDNSENQSKRYNIIGQVTSLAYPFAQYRNDTASVFSHLLCPLIFSRSVSALSRFKLLLPGAKSFKDHQRVHNYKPFLVFPTVDDIAKSNFGFMSGSAVHFNYSGHIVNQRQYEQNIKPYLYRWRSGDKDNVTGREDVTPHVKVYCCDNADNWASLRWALIGSHNLSKQAWGGKKNRNFDTNDPSKYEVSSYELSIFIPLNPEENQKLIPVYGCDILPYDAQKDSSDIPLRMPFKLPPTKYKSTDQPWSGHLDFGDSLKDTWGNSYRGL